MSDSCCSQPSAGSATSELPAPTLQHPPSMATTCPVCGEKGKPVQGQTVKALLSISLRQVRNDVEYLFCHTQTCPVVYFSPDGAQTFTIKEIRERVYQKEPDAEDVLVCYCFKHRIGEIHAATHEIRLAILDDINAGIQADQCACDLRNPQGSCCLGNVRDLVKRLEQSTTPTTA